MRRKRTQGNTTRHVHYRPCNFCECLYVQSYSLEQHFHEARPGGLPTRDCGLFCECLYVQGASLGQHLHEDRQGGLPTIERRLCRAI